MESATLSFGIIGMTFGIMAWGQIADVRKELKTLKQDLEDTGTLKSPTE